MKTTYFLILVTAICALFQLTYAHELVLWDISLIQNGQWWRIVTGNFTHTNVIHLVMNMAALWIITYLFRPNAKSLCGSLLAISVFIGLALLLFPLNRYAGLSGVLHGIFAFYALREVIQGRKSSWLLVIGVAGKIAYEQLYGASATTAELINARVATEAHLLGGIAGLLLIGAIWATDRSRKQID